MSIGPFLVAAALLSLERICYVWIWRAPDDFRAAVSAVRVPGVDDPVDAVRALFYVFKVLQIAVFLWWCDVHGTGVWWPPAGNPVALILGTAMIAFGQMLSLAVFWRLGRVGVFYGARFGRVVPWCREFPFSVTAHPQYVGTVLSIWGFFLVMRFPYGDWYALPALETIYYALGARLEQ